MHMRRTANTLQYCFRRKIRFRSVHTSHRVPFSITNLIQSEHPLERHFLLLFLVKIQCWKKAQEKPQKKKTSRSLWRIYKHATQSMKLSVLMKTVSLLRSFIRCRLRMCARMEHWNHSAVILEWRGNMLKPMLRIGVTSFRFNWSQPQLFPRRIFVRMIVPKYVHNCSPEHWKTE